MYTDAKWWKADTAGIAKAVANALRLQGAYRVRLRDEHYTRDSAYTRVTTDVESMLDTLGRNRTKGRIGSVNIVRSAVDTFCNWLFSGQYPVGIRSAGVPFEQMFALERYSAALMSEMGTPRTQRALEEAARDAVLHGRGYAWFKMDRGRIVAKRLKPSQVVIDPVDDEDGDPSAVIVLEAMDRAAAITWARSWGADKSVLAAMDRMARAQTADLLEGAGKWTVRDSDLALMDSYTDRLVIVHACRRATSETAKDGRYAIVVFGGNAEEPIAAYDDREYESTFLPVARFECIGSSDDRLSIGNILLPVMEQLDETIDKIQRTVTKYSHAKLATARYGLTTGDDGELSHDEELAITAMASAGVQLVPALPPGSPPQFIQPSVISQEELAWSDRVMQTAMNLTGINQLMTRGMSSLGAGASGAAQVEEVATIEERFALAKNAWHRFRLDLAQLALRMLDYAVAQNPEYAIAFETGERAFKHTWADLQKQVAGVTVELEIRGAQSDSRAARIAKVQEQAAQGLHDAVMVKYGLLGPTADTRAMERLALAGFRAVAWQLSQIIEAGEDGQVDDFMPFAETDIDSAILLSTAYINLGVVEGAKPETLNRLRSYRDAATSMATEAAPSAAPAALPQAIPAEMMAV